MNLFQAIFRSNHESPALLYEQKEVSYGDLREQTLKVARAFLHLGLQRKDRVALLLNDSPEFVESFIAVCSLGAIAVPINMALRLEEQRAILDDCGARVAVVEGELCQTLLTDVSKKLQLPEILLKVDRDMTKTASAGSAYSLSSVIDMSAANSIPEFVVPGPDEAAFILYTSGSTGQAKGAVHRQADIFYTNETYCRQVLAVTADDRLFSSSRLPFAYGLGNSFTFPLLNGATSILCRDKPSPEIIDKIFREYRPTIFFGVPVIFNLLLEYHRRESALDCSSLRLCISAGEALPAHLGEAWEHTFGVPVLDGIGSTEMLHMFMSNRVGEMKYGSSGKLLKGYEARLLDEHGQPIAGDHEGNLWVNGYSAAAEYWQRPAETQRTFVDGWVRTGDLYRSDNDGYWYHMGRSDDCFKSSGQWVSPVEVEGVLARHPAVSRIAVVEDFDDDGLPCPCAFVVSKDVEFDRVQFESELRERAAALPRFKRPRTYRFTTELPYTATGKIQRFKLRQQLRRP